MMKLKKILAILLAAAIIFVLAACGKTPTTGGDSSEIDFKGYPVGSDMTITYWGVLNGLLSQTVQNFGDSPLGTALIEQTGVNVKYIHPQGDEQFSILMASDELPDIIEYNWYTFSGGPQKALDEQIIIPLNDIIDKYCPNLKKYLQENPEIDKMIKTDDGTYYCFPFIRGDDRLLTNCGPMIRKDWLDELNLSVPETISEWHNVLTQFKEKKNASAPLSFSDATDVAFKFGAFIGAYGLNYDFFIDNGKVIYGPADPRYKEFLTTFSEWYKEGLLDNDIVNVDGRVVTANLLNGSTGATVAYAGSGLGVYTKTLQEKEPNAVLTSAPYPSLTKGVISERGQRDVPYLGGGAAAITASCKNVELAARFLDYGYSEKGSLLFNFGIEGESYNMVDGYPTYTDLIMKNPDGLTISQAMSHYIKANTAGVFVQRKEYIEQYYELPEQKAALDVWSNHNEINYQLPRISLTSEESTEVANIMSNISTFVSERTFQYIMGKEDLSNFDNYLATINSYGIDKVLKIYEDAYKRYQER